MRRLTAMLICALMLTASAFADARVMVVTDIHYLDRSLYEGSDFFVRALRNGDGKLTQYGDELLAALAAEIRSVRPDALLVTGDLTFNGEKVSHQALAEWFASVEAMGVPVWVIPGNHDINVPKPVGYGNQLVYGTAPVTAEEFRAIYADFLLDPPAGAQAGFSYLAPIRDTLWAAMTDVAFYADGAQTFGMFTAGHSAWLRGALDQAAEAGAEVITATHHSMIAHTDFARDSYLMLGSEAMQALEAEYGVRLNLSGHLHLQHIAQLNGLTDAALEAFCMWPHRWALVTLSEDGRMTYEARSLSADSLPEGFLDMSRTWFAETARDKLLARMAGEPDALPLAEYAAAFQLASFSGTFHPDDPFWTDDPARALWEKRQNDAQWQYMKPFLEGDPDAAHGQTDALNWSSEGTITPEGGGEDR